jgi:alpha-L-rhamnosidase
MPWDFYLQYGDIDMLKENFEGMKGYIHYMTDWVDEEGIMYSQRTGKDGKVLRWFNLGEWAAPGETVPDDMVHTFYYWLCAELTSQTASVLNNNEDAKKYKEFASKTWNAFHKKYYDSEKGTYGDGGGNIFALKMKVPEERYDKVINSLKKDIGANKGHLDTGIFGTRYFFDVLSENGMHELAYEAMTKQTQPSYGFWLTDGATTSREHWNGSGSRNHPMFGGGLSWLYKNLAGININPSHPGYQHIIFNPQIVSDLDYVSYKNNTIRGEAGISWKNGKDNTDIDIIVPVGSTATVYIPSDDPADITESNISIEKSKDVKISRVENGKTVLEVGSGSYSFKVEK